MGYWPFLWIGVALAAVPVIHWLLLGRMFAVSGRFTAINDRFRALVARDPDPTEDEMTAEEMAAALRAATAAAFGGEALGAAPEPVAATPGWALAPVKQNTASHLLFLGGVALGGALAAFLGGHLAPGGVSAMGPTFVRIFGEDPALAAGALFGGGLLVGFGTRMAGGCTSGHGLCGVSRFQPGSLVATASFFGMGIAVSFALSLAAR